VGIVLRKKIFSAILSLGLVLTMNVTVFADTITQLQQQKKELVEQRDAAKKQRKEFVDSYNEKKNEVEDIEIAIQQLDSKIEGLLIDIEQNKNDLEVCQENIIKAETSVADAEEALQQQQELLDARMRAMYKNGSNGYVGIILKAKGFSDLVTRVEAINKMANFDKKVIEEMDEKREDLDEKRRSLEEEKVRIEKLKSDNEAKKAVLDESKADQRLMLSKYKKQMDEFDKKVDYYFNIISGLDSKIKKKENQISTAIYNSTRPSRGETNYSTDEVVQYALTFRGIRYKWGGNTPEEGFDCSGYVRYVYAHFGVYLPRTSYTQINVGTPISRENLQPGDLVFFGYGTPHHVGMYIGDDCYIHAPQTGDVVKISPLTRKDYMGARRVK
jgi:cell wall-associated NlpC family hydrolase